MRLLALGREVPTGAAKSQEVVTLLLLGTFDLDWPTHGLIRIPDTPPTHLPASMALPQRRPGPARPQR